LRRLLGESDIATPSGRPEENEAGASGVLGPQNYRSLLGTNNWQGILSLYRLGKKSLVHRTSPRRVPVFNPLRQHMDAMCLRARLSEDVWRNYFKFTIEGNPWDRNVSYYHCYCRDSDDLPLFQQFVQTGRNFPYKSTMRSTQLPASLRSMRSSPMRILAMSSMGLAIGGVGLSGLGLSWLEPGRSRDIGRFMGIRSSTMRRRNG